MENYDYRPSPVLHLYWPAYMGIYHFLNDWWPKFSRLLHHCCIFPGHLSILIGLSWNFGPHYSCTFYAYIFCCQGHKKEEKSLRITKKAQSKKIQSWNNIRVKNMPHMYGGVQIGRYADYFVVQYYASFSWGLLKLVDKSFRDMSIMPGVNII